MNGPPSRREPSATRHLLLPATLFVVLVAPALATPPPPPGKTSPPIHVRAQRLNVSGPKGKPSEELFSGHVLLRQGDVTLHADRVRMQLSPGGGLVQATAWGQPAHFVQKPPKGPVTLGHALQIVYRAARNTYTLTGRASLTRGTEHVRAHRIVYDRTTATVEAFQAPGGKRVSIVVPQAAHPPHPHHPPRH
jgi:lipopolysaccharide export system protein LptA